MLSTARSRAAWLSRRVQVSARRTFAVSANHQQEVNNPSKPTEIPNVSKTNELPIETPHRDEALQESAEEGETKRVLQAPNRANVWSRSQNPRAKAMTGPRFEQTILDYQPRPEAAIALIHKQPIRWTHKRVVECDGGGGPLGHPRVFINVDKPEVCTCTYCGLPFANEHHRKHLESVGSPFPLEAQGDAAEINQSQRISNEALGQR